MVRRVLWSRVHFQISPYPLFAEQTARGLLPNWKTFVAALSPSIQPTANKIIATIERKLAVSAENKPALVARRTDRKLHGGLMLTWYTRDHFAEWLLSCNAIDHSFVETRTDKHKFPEVSAIATILWAAPWWRLYWRGSVR